MAGTGTYRVDAAWTTQLLGVFRIGISEIGGTDVISGAFGNNVFDDITADVQELLIDRGRTNDLDQLMAGHTRVVLRDPNGKYNPANASSILYPNVKPMRPLRVQCDAAADYRAEVLADSPVAYWRCGERSGTVLNDISGGYYQGAIGANVTKAAAGALTNDADTALTFPRATGAANVALIPYAAALNPSVFSVECWVRPTTDAADMVPFSGRPAVGNSGWLFDRLSATTKWIFRLFDSAAGAISAVHPTTGSSPINTWVHLVGVYDGENLRLYQDGAFVAQNTLKGAPVNASADTCIGANGGGTNTAFGGQVDECAIYNTVLSDARILAHYQAGIGTRTTTYTRFRGFIQSITSSPGLREQVATLNVADLFSWLQLARPTIASTGATTTGAAIGLVLDSIGFTEAALRALDTGDSISDFSADGSLTALDLIKNLLASERGLFFISAAGVATYHDRAHRYRSPRHTDMSVVVDQMQRMIGRTDVEQIINDARVTRSGGTEQIATDTDSINDYARRVLVLSDLDYLTTDAAALSLATYMVVTYSDPTQPFTVDLLNSTDLELVLMLARDLGDRVRIIDSRGGTDASFYLEQIVEQVGSQGRIGQTGWLVSEKPTNSPFIIGVSGLGGLDVISI